GPPVPSIAGVDGVALCEPDPGTPTDPIHLDVAERARTLSPELGDVAVRVPSDGVLHAPQADDVPRVRGPGCRRLGQSAPRGDRLRARVPAGDRRSDADRAVRLAFRHRSVR